MVLDCLVNIIVICGIDKMISIIHYISAIRRLKESDKTIHMLGGEKEAPPLVLAQRDMIKHEKEYYRDEALKLLIYCVGIAMSVLIFYTVFTVFDKVGAFKL